MDFDRRYPHPDPIEIKIANDEESVNEEDVKLRGFIAGCPI